MPAYHPQAKLEVQSILAKGGRGVKRCLGMMVARHLRIDGGSEPLLAAEQVGAGSGVSMLYEVSYAYGLWSSVTCVYETTSAHVMLLAVDARQGTVRIGAAGTAPDARARAWNRSS